MANSHSYCGQAQEVPDLIGTLSATPWPGCDLRSDGATPETKGRR
jgi:hypothetical protein